MDIFVLALIFCLLMLVGLPIGTALGISAVFTIWQFDLGISMIGINFVHENSGLRLFNA